MSDGSIRISIEVDGKKVEYAAKELDNLESAGHRGGKGAKQAEDGMKGVDRESSKASGSVKKFATSLGLVAIGAMAFKTLKGAMDDAISRFDTLNQFPKVLQALGVSAEDSERAMTDLSDGIDGLPTKLDDIASTAQRMYTSFGDMDKATDSALALNNSLLGSAASAEQASRGTEMYLKVLQTGQMDLQTWRSLSETMDVGLVKIAESFGYAGKSAKDDLYNALREGHITIDEFNDKLIEVGTGTGIMAKLARENSLGLATSLTNLRTAVSRNLANVIESFNKLSKEVTGKEIAEHLDDLKHVVNVVFKTITRTIEGAAPVVKLFASAVSATIPIIKALTPVIWGLIAAYGAHAVITKARAAIHATHKIINIAQASTKALTLATSAQIAAQAASTTATTADTVAKAAQAGTISLSTLAIGTMTGAISVSTAVQTVATAATYAFGAAIRFLMGPVGWVVGGIGLLTAGVTALVKWFKRSSKEGERLSKETENLKNETDSLIDSVEQNKKAYKDSQKEIESTSKANRDLAERIEDLALKENKSAAEKQLLKDNIDQLNESVGDLNLSYDEEADALSMSSEQLQARLDLTKEQTSYNDALERQVEITKEQNKVDLQLEEINELRAESKQLHEDETITKKEHEKAMAELDEQEQALIETHKELGEEYQKVELQVTESMENMIELVESGAISQTEMVDTWVENNQELVDSMRDSYQEIYEITTDAFDRINDESKVSAEEMIENLKHNQEMMAEWGDNISELMGFASEHGYENFLHWLETLGPESAAEVAVISEMSDKELEEFANIMERGADVSTETFGKVLGEGMEESAKILGDHITGLSDTMQSAARDANFEKIGEDIVEGYVDGIIGGTPKAEKASRDMAEGTIDVAKDTLDTQSPSKVFKALGGNVTEGLSLGISDGTNKVIQTAKNLLKSMVSEFNSMYSDFNKIGRDAMSGLNAGLNAGRGRVLSTARSIANQVAGTMKQALEIRSPSRLFRREIGQMIPTGIALGMEDEERNVYDTLKRMSQKMIDFVSPNVAFSAQMAGSHATSAPINQSSTTNTYNNVKLDGLFNGATFNVRDEQDVEHLARQLGDYIKNTARGRGIKTL